MSNRFCFVLLLLCFCGGVRAGRVGRAVECVCRREGFRTGRFRVLCATTLGELCGRKVLVGGISGKLGCCGLSGGNCCAMGSLLGSIVMSGQSGLIGEVQLSVVSTRCH